jgi:hypothetical protein
LSTICVMQPYFFPYAGYFRLMALADTFIILDCVQFPRTGWVHRNKFTNQSNRLDWLTLPITKKPRETTRILDLEFRPDFESIIRQDLYNFKLFNDSNKSHFIDYVIPQETNVTGYLQSTLASILAVLEIDVDILRSSTLKINSQSKGEFKIIEICKAVGADTYVNLNGGAHYYSRKNFNQSEIDLKILSPYLGSTSSILERIAFENPRKVKSEIESNIYFIDSGD